MTIVAAFQSNDIPILIGDMAISANDLRSTLRKKIYWISPNFVIGWSGSLLTATGILKSILARFNGRSISRAEIEEFFQVYLGDTSKELESVFIGWIVEEQPHCFLWRTSYPKKVFYSHSYSVGSGEKYFEDLLKPSSSLWADGNVTGDNEALYDTLLHTGKMFFEETLYPKQWNQTYGFAYDLLGYWQGQFRYVHTITHLGWDYHWDDEKETGRLEQAPFIAKYINFGHFSALQRVIHKDLNVIEQTNYASKPIYDDMPGLNLSHMGFSILQTTI